MSHISFSIGSLDVPLTVQRAEIREELSTPMVAIVHATTALPALPPGALVGQTATLSLSGGGLFEFDLLGERTWTGVCRDVALVKVELTGASTYRFEIVAPVALLALRRSYRVFQDLSAPSIASKILEAAGFSATVQIDDEAHPRRELRVQYGETDADFFHRMLEEAGVAYATAESGELVLSDHWETGECRVVPLSYVDHPAEALGRPFVTELELASALRPGALALGDYDFRRPNTPLWVEAPKAGEIEAALAQQFFLPGAALVAVDHGSGTPAADDRGAFRHDERAAKADAQRLLEALREGRDELRFSTNAMDMAPGAVFRVEGYPHPALASAPRLLCTAIHIEAEFGKPLHIRARAVFADAPYRPPRRTQKPRALGVETAVVVGPPKQEIHTDEFGRVRVQFPWDREGGRDAKSSCWVRVSQAWAGLGYGALALPRVGQEVLVAFLAGDPDRPVIVGRLHNAIEQTPYKLPEDQTVTGIRTASTPGGAGWNELRFDDRAGAELVAIRAERDLQKLVRHDEREKTGHNRTIGVGEDLQVEVEGDEARRTEGRRAVRVGGDDTLDVGGSRKATIAGSDTVVVAQKHSVSVGPSKTGAEIVDKRISLGTGGAKLVMDGPDVTLSASGTISLRADGAIVIDAAASVTVVASGDVVIDGGGNVRVKS
ncbi:type VI secretion system tip protein TssI/VgrG [Polyangium sp. y55x31]|uniref:type VI secretion system Vgr family protein n=1 Tax=Polyangium sp. y55x31 TaxID=3042688 RepID=UPI0024832DCC|nr:type VI secretion system tip protein TssI/VgrG [Polyangium sp. y55x31]MDI1483580.1 type VI secretion system tip protein TssI/VgrG [Polyangium sp. y55x31]